MALVVKGRWQPGCSGGFDFRVPADAKDLHLLAASWSNAYVRDDQCFWIAGGARPIYHAPVTVRGAAVFNDQLIAVDANHRWHMLQGVTGSAGAPAAVAADGLLLQAAQRGDVTQVAAGEQVILILYQDGCVQQATWPQHMQVAASPAGGPLSHHMPGADIASRSSALAAELDYGMQVRCVTLARPVCHIACGVRHQCVLDNEGGLWAWGWGLHGQLGNGQVLDVDAPQHVTALGGIRVVGVACGLGHTVACCTSGGVYAWGWNQWGQLGCGDTVSRLQPTLVEDCTLQDEHVTKVSCGARHTAVLTAAGTVYAWGWDKYGQVTGCAASPARCPRQSASHDAVQQPQHDDWCRAGMAAQQTRTGALPSTGVCTGPGCSMQQAQLTECSLAQSCAPARNLTGSVDLVSNASTVTMSAGQGLATSKWAANSRKDNAAGVHEAKATHMQEDSKAGAASREALLIGAALQLDTPTELQESPGEAECCLSPVRMHISGVSGQYSTIGAHTHVRDVACGRWFTLLLLT